jgi:hypothetical protein
MTRREIKTALKTFIIIGAFVLLIGYAGFRAQSFIQGPQLTITSPTSGTTTTSSVVEISGTTKNISFITLNGDKIFTDKNGVFKNKLLLSYGYNIITVEAKDRFGRTIDRNIQLVYK